MQRDDEDPLAPVVTETTAGGVLLLGIFAGAAVAMLAGNDPWFAGVPLFGGSYTLYDMVQRRRGADR